MKLGLFSSIVELGVPVEIYVTGSWNNSHGLRKGGQAWREKPVPHIKVTVQLEAHEAGEMERGRDEKAKHETG